MPRMDQEPQYDDEPLGPPSREQQEGDAWEYWHQRARALEAEVARLRSGPKEKGRGETITRIIREVAELPDRTSPEDQPEMMLVSCDELEAILEAALPSEHIAEKDAKP